MMSRMPPDSSRSSDREDLRSSQSSNSFSGNARTVFQVRDIHGNINVIQSHARLAVVLGAVAAAGALMVIVIMNSPKSSDDHRTAGSVQYVIQPESCGALQYGANGNAGPVLCPDGRPNLLLDRWYRKIPLKVLGLGPNASPIDVKNAICADFSSGRTTIPIESGAAKLAEVEQQWHFGITFSNGVDPSMCS
jgi:hypothetical protein